MAIDTQKIFNIFEKSKSDKTNFTDYAQDISEIYLPRKDHISKKKVMGGERLRTDIFDSTPRQSLNIFAAGLMGYLTNQSQVWANLGIQDRRLKGNVSVRRWFDEVEEVIFALFRNSNFYSEMHEFYLVFGAFGTATMFMEGDLEDGIRFRSLDYEEIYVMEDAKGRVDTLFREVEMTVKQMVDKFGENVSKEVSDKFKAGNLNDKVDILHVVMPRTDREIGKEDDRNMPFMSVYFDKDKKTVLSEGGFEYFPFPTARFLKENKYPYGYSPAMVSLPDARELNKFHYIFVRGAAKQVDPPTFWPDDGYIFPKNLGPGQNVFRKSDSTYTAAPSPLLSGGRVDVGIEILGMKQEMIRNAYYVDLFLSLTQQTKQMTATEAQIRKNEGLLLLGPTLSRLNDEVLSPLLTNVFNQLLLEGKFPEMPEELKQLNAQGQLFYNIDYVSPLAISQKQLGLESINLGLNFLAQVSEFSPEVLDIINPTKVSKKYLKDINFPSGPINSDEEIEEIRQAKNEALQQQAQMEQAQQAGQILKDVAQAEGAVSE